ncbi:MAG: MFS transporter [Bauldia sp.]
MADAALAALPDETMARRNAWLLTFASAFAGSIAPISISLGGLAGGYLLDADKSLSTLPVSAFMVGVAAAAVPAAMLMRRIGRRAGFIFGTAIGAAGGVAAGMAVLAGSFAAFVAAMAFTGTAGAFAQQYRFAAADDGSPAFRARAIAMVMAAGVASAIIGPQVSIRTRDLFSPIPFAGAFFAIAGLSLIAMAALAFLGGKARAAPTTAARSGGRPLGAIVRQPRFLIAVACAAASFAAMSLVMTAAPLAMIGCGLSQDDAALGIQWHIVAMFAPSFVTGHLIARFGKETIVAIGLALLVACVAVALAGIALANFWTALILLGVGWNFGFIGGTAMLTETYRPEEAGRVQGINDLIVFGSVALASLSAGRLYVAAGWEWVAYAAVPLLAVIAVALATAFARRGVGAAG